MVAHIANMQAMQPMHLDLDDLSRPQVHQLLHEHLSHMFELSPPEQVFALDLSKLRAPEITSYLQEVMDVQKQRGPWILTGSQDFALMASCTTTPACFPRSS